jgi:hypothetical protein
MITDVQKNDFQGGKTSLETALEKQEKKRFIYIFLKNARGTSK